MPKSDMTVRRPRHDVIEVAQVAAWIVSNREDQSWHVSDTLIDLSRNGCRLIAACHLEPDDTVRLVMDQPNAEQRTEILAEVRWRRRAADGWEYGFEFVTQLEWEFLGELFLSGTLEDR